MAVETRGIVVWEAGASVTPEPIVVDEPGPGEVLVRIEASGVCHTDLHVQKGHIGTPPILLGHEGAGVVEAVGAGVSEPRVGDYVILAWRAPCGVCRFCRQGRLHLCAASLNAQPRQHTPTERSQHRCWVSAPSPRIPSSPRVRQFPSRARFRRRKPA